MLKFGKATVRTDNEEMYVRNRTTGAVGRMMTLTGNTTPDNYEEIPVAEYDAQIASQDAEREYKREIVRLVRQRYDADDEMAILRQRDTKPEEFEEYNDFVESCKSMARVRTLNL